MIYVAELHCNSGREFSEEEKKLLQKAAEDFNLRTMEMANPKRMAIEAIYSHHLKIRLYSTLPLRSIGRAMRGYTNLLIEHSDFAKRMTSAGLFRTVMLGEKEQQEPDTPSAPPDQISDLALLQALQRYLFERKEGGATVYRRKRAAIEQMKTLAKESGIL